MLWKFIDKEVAVRWDNISQKRKQVPVPDMAGGFDLRSDLTQSPIYHFVVFNLVDIGNFLHGGKMVDLLDSNKLRSAAGQLGSVDRKHIPLFQ